MLVNNQWILRSCSSVSEKFELCCLKRGHAGLHRSIPFTRDGKRFAFYWGVDGKETQQEMGQDESSGS